jgi:pimeloyl-ACP methyl ester carboxylesterase
MRERHPGGDNQIQTLFDNFRTFALNHSDMDFTPAKLSAITARTLIVHGDRDEFFSIDIPVDLYRSIPDAGLWVLPYTAHGGLLEKLAQSTSAEAVTELKLPITAMEFLRGRQGV